MYYISHRRGFALILIAASFLTTMFIFNYYFQTGKTLGNLTETELQKMVEVRLNERRENLENFCIERRQITQQSSAVNHVLRRMFIDMDHNLAWCPIFKAASSVWMKRFAQLGGKFNERVSNLINKGIIQWNMLARKAYPVMQDTKTSYSNLNKTTRFLIVRHPFERLLSAYRDKLEHREGREFYYKRYSTYIKNTIRQQWELKDEPTFLEFLTFLVKSLAVDEHWIPITRQCLPCTIRYDFILKTETFDEDNHYMLQKLRLQNKVDRYLEENVNLAGKTNLRLAKIYYGTIPKKLLEEVYQLYKEDFLFFDYAPDEYYTMTK